MIDKEMKLLLTRIAILAAVSAVSIAAAGEVAAEETNPSPAKEQAAAKQKTPAPNPGAPENVEQAGSKDEDFVDRDGDGIQDGKEHRFRRNKGSRDPKTRRTAKRRGNASKKRGSKGSGG